MDRIHSARLALAAVEHITHCFEEDKVLPVFVGIVNDDKCHTELRLFNELVDFKNRRPLHQFWLEPISKGFSAVSFPPKSFEKTIKPKL